jgi:hypothetical protein
MRALRFTRFGALRGALAIACLLMAASSQAAHPRPKSATPIRMSLVPAYAGCAAPNRTHGPPLVFSSCNPPAQTSAQATVGTPDAFGGAVNATSYLLLRYFHGPPAPVDDVDILINSVVNDVRCMPTGTSCGTANDSGPADYAGETRFSFTFRVTDHWNAVVPGGGTDPATVQDFTTEFSVQCAQSAATSTGSTCNASTSLNAVVPGALKDGKRASHELLAVRIYDGGPNGDGDTIADNTVFARPGVFIP